MFQKKSDDYLYLYIKNLFKFSFKAGFPVHDNHFKLCGLPKNSKWIMCSGKTGVRCGYLRLLVYK